MALYCTFAKLLAVQRCQTKTLLHSVDACPTARCPRNRNVKTRKEKKNDTKFEGLDFFLNRGV